MIEASFRYGPSFIHIIFSFCIIPSLDQVVRFALPSVAYYFSGSELFFSPFPSHWFSTCFFFPMTVDSPSDTMIWISLLPFFVGSFCLSTHCDDYHVFTLYLSFFFLSAWRAWKKSLSQDTTNPFLCFTILPHIGILLFIIVSSTDDLFVIFIFPFSQHGFLPTFTYSTHSRRTYIHNPYQRWPFFSTTKTRSLYIYIYILFIPHSHSRSRSQRILIPLQIYISWLTVSFSSQFALHPFTLTLLIDRLIDSSGSISHPRTHLHNQGAKSVIFVRRGEKKEWWGMHVHWWYPYYSSPFWSWGEVEGGSGPVYKDNISIKGNGDMELLSSVTHLPPP